jgi:integrase
LRARPVDEIDTETVLAILKPIWLEKPETASRLRGRIEAVLDAAKAQGLRSGENPARWRGHLSHLLPKRQKLTRGHFAAMPYVEVPTFMAQLRDNDTIAARALEFTILTATRSGETYGCRWAEIDLDARVWVIPASRAKAARATVRLRSSRRSLRQGLTILSFRGSPREAAFARCYAQNR